MTLLQRYCLVAVALMIAAPMSRAALVAEWNFDALVGGTTLEDQVGTIDGTKAEAAAGEITVVASTAGVTGATGFGNAYDIGSSSTSTHINLGTTATTGAISNFGTGAFSVAGWFDADERNSGSNDRWLIGDLGGNGGYVFYLRRGSDATNRGKLIAAIGGPSNGTQISYMGSQRLDLNSDSQQWHWFAVTSDGLSMRVYLDGELLTTVAYIAGTTATPDAGSSGLIGRAFDGRLDQFTVYNHKLDGTLSGSTLTGGELYSLWQQGVPEPASLGLVALGGLMLLRRR